MVIPHTSANSFFVDHVESVGVYRLELANFFLQYLPAGLLTADEFKTQMDELSFIQTSWTLHYLASGKPIYGATFTLQKAINTTPVTKTPTFIVGISLTLIYIVSVVAVVGIYCVIKRSIRRWRMKNSLRLHEESYGGQEDCSDPQNEFVSLDLNQKS